MDFPQRFFFRNDTDKYAIELLKAAREMPVYVAERLAPKEKLDPIIKNASSKIEVINYLIRHG